MKLILENLSKNFEEKMVLDNINFSFEKGKIYGIIGKNGAGKTTLFNILNNELESSSGKFYIEQNDQVKSVDFEDIGMVTDSPILPDFLTGFEFIRYYLSMVRNEINSEESKVRELFNIIKLNYYDQNKLIKEYSFGMRNKLQLLLCLIKNPSIILLDEPLSSFDIVVSHDIKELLINMKKDHIIIMSTHILQLALDVCDEILLLKNGKLINNDYLNHKQENFENYLIKELEN